MAQLYTGTSGFAYPAWKPNFYPAKLASTRFLDHYATRLNSVEVNYTYRTIPTVKTLEGWLQKVPENFQFCPKANMQITHIKKLVGAESVTEVFLQRLQSWRDAKKLGPILFQLPPSLPCDLERLASFLMLLPKDNRYTFEFRHRSWFTGEVYDRLKKHNISLCIAEAEKLETPDVSTADFIYYRLRKPDYSPEDVAEMSAKTKELVAQGKDVYVFFKHENTPDGALNAERLWASHRADSSLA